MRSPLEWREMYSEETMKKALDRVKVVAFTQSVVSQAVSFFLIICKKHFYTCLNPKY